MSSTRHAIRTGRGYRLVFWIERTGRTQARLPLVILSHGLGGTHENPLISTLARRLLAQGYEVIRYDLAGHGKSGGGIKARLVRNFTADLSDLVPWCAKRNSGRPRSVVLIGHSIGALGTLIAAYRLQAAVAGIVLIGCNAHAKKKFHQLKAQGRLRRLARYWVVGRAKVALDFWSDRSRFEPERFAKRTAVPALVLCGSRDRTNPPGESKALVRWLRGPKEFRLIPKTDHYFADDYSRTLCARQILRWLKKIG